MKGICNGSEISCIEHEMTSNRKTMKAIVNQSLAPDELFLVNGFKLMVSQTIAKMIIDWFTEKFMVIYRADAIQLIRRFSDPQKKTIFVEKTVTEAAKD